MAVSTTSSLKVALGLEALGNFSSTHTQSREFAGPLYLAGRGVQGRLSLTYSAGALPVQIHDIVKVVLNGSSSIRIPWKGPGTVQRYTRLQSSFLDLVHVSRIADEESSADDIHVDFSFVLPEVVSFRDPTGPENTLKEKQHFKWNLLPSSLVAESVATTDMNGSTQSVHAIIVYTLRAQVFRHSVLLGYATMAVRIYNDMNAQPPICVADFPSEYRCLHRKSLVRRFRKTGAFFSVVITEPAPFSFSGEKDSALTELPVSVAYHMPNGRHCDSAQKPPGLIGATFTWRIKSLTFLSTQPLTSIPIAVLPGKQSSVSMIAVLGRKHQLKWQLPSRRNPPTTLVQSCDDSWTESLKLPLVINRAILPAPPVFTPHICRRYNLELWVRLEGPASDRTTLQLEVPVQIAYPRERGSYGSNGLPPAYSRWNDLEPEEDNSAMEVPIYSP